MLGETDLATLLRDMEPRLNEGQFVFCSVSDAAFHAPAFKPVCSFRELEGVTVILERRDADAASLAYTGMWAWITLTVHSDLNAIGFLAAVTERLAAAGIAVNAVSAFYHDHLFVPWDARNIALDALRERYLPR